MAISQNGWPANDGSVSASYTIPGTEVRIALRKGDASVVLLHYLAWFHRNIEPIRQKDTGGYNPRPIKGTTTLSNHASGTAFDHNWNDHVQGKRNTFTADEQAAMRKQAKFYEGVLRLGIDYSNPDDMHGEINRGTAETRRIADKIRAQARQQEDDMPEAKDVWNADVIPIAGGHGGTWVAGGTLGLTYDRANAALAGVTRLETAVTRLSVVLNTFIANEGADDVARSKALQRIEAAITQIAPIVAQTVVANLPQGGDQVSQDEVTAAVEAAFRNAFTAA